MIVLVKFVWRGFPERLIGIGTVNAGTDSTLVPAIQACREAHEGTTVDVRAMLQRDVENALSEGQSNPAWSISSTATTRRRPRSGSCCAAAGPWPYCPPITDWRLFGSEPPSTWHSADSAERGKHMVADGLGATILPDHSAIGDLMHRAD